VARPGAEKQEPGLVALDNGDQTVFKLLAVSDGSTAKVDSKELDMARDYLLKNYGQADFSAYVAQLRANADVYIRPER
jgi:peptidyl-prolyl cis-trans isomerase D